MDLSDVMSRYLTCPVCQDLVNIPVETSCCENVFCNGCVVGVEKCPSCRKNPVRVYADCKPIIVFSACDDVLKCCV